MGKGDNAKGFFNNIAASAVWESLKTWGGPFVTSLAAAIWEYLRHQSVDWWGIVCLFVLTAAVIWFGRGKSNAGDSPNPTSNAPDSNPPPRLSAESQADMEALSAPAVRDPYLTLNFADRTARENNDSLVQFGQKTALLFKPIQIEAFQLAHDIRVLMEQAGARPGITVTRVTPEDDIWHHADVLAVWRMRFLSAYKVHYSSRVAIVWSEFWEMPGHARLGSLYQDPKNEKDLDEICALLVCQAHYVDGIKVEVFS